MNRTAYSLTSGTLRTDETFIKRTDPLHHNKNYVNNPNVLEANGFGMVSMFVIDPMHLVDLGLSKKFLLLMIEKNLFKLKKTEISDISQSFVDLGKYVPLEFVRKPRPFSELRRYKATELRFFLLYAGIVLLKDILSDEKYYHFLLLSCGIRILSDESLYHQNNITADLLLKEYVKLYPNIFGRHFVSSNVHNLVHLSKCVEDFGCLYSFSGYKFENFLQTLKSYVRKPTDILQQLYNRIKYNFEREDDIQRAKKSFEKSEIQISKKSIGIKNKFTFKANEKDCFCYTKSDLVFHIFYLRTYNSQNVVFGKRFLDKKSVFLEPVDSADLSIYVVEEESHNYEIINMDEIILKFMKLPRNKCSYMIPILHSTHE